MATVTSPQIAEYPESAVLWTRDECRELEEAGFLDYRYELIGGVIIKKMGQRKSHAHSVMCAILWLAGNFGGEYVQTQTPIDVSPEDNPTNAPEPDVVLLNTPLLTIPTDSPQPKHIRLNIEVSDATLRNDLNLKAGLYARARILEYWVISVEERRLYIHTEPQNGVYGTRTVHSETETVALQSAPQVTVLVADLLPILTTSLAGLTEGDAV